MTPTRTISRWLLPVAGLAVAALAVGVGGFAWKRRQAERRALALAEASVAQTPDGDRAIAAQAVEAAPWFHRAHAVRAEVEARCGDLDLAREELALAGTDERARRARAWILFREDRTPEALEALKGTGFEQSDGDLLAFASRGPVRDGSAMGPERLSTLTPGEARSLCETSREYHAGTVGATLGRSLLARIATVELDDARADALLEEMAALPWPIDRRYLASTRAEIAAIRSGSELGVEPWVKQPGGQRLDDTIADLDQGLVAHAADRARIELEVHRLFARDDCLVHAVARLRRALALSTTVGRERLLALLARARARKTEWAAAAGELLDACRRNGSHDLACEAAQLALARGDEAAARKWFAWTLGGATHDREHFDVFDALFDATPWRRREFMGGELTNLDEASTAQALRALALDRPWEARDFLEKIDAYWTLRACSIAREDPVGALALLSPKVVQSRDASPTIAAFAAVIDDDPATLARKLQQHGLSADDAQAVAGVVEETRSDLRKRELLP